jgi:uncharacterized protein YjbI with pentapeptide repeats
MGFEDKKPDGNIETPPEALAPGVPASTPALPDIAAKADDLEEIKKTVEDAASVSGGLWLSYLSALSYVTAAANTVTLEDLLLERPVKLPFFNVETPLVGFFALASFVVLMIHAYALMHFFILGKKTSRFHNELRRQIPDGDMQSRKSGAVPGRANKEIRDKLRWVLPSNIFVQTLAGPPELRHGLYGMMQTLISLTTLVVFPIFVLLLLQIQFLPFHDTRITWAQRGALFLDIVLLWRLRPPILSDLSAEISSRARILSRALRGFGLAVAIGMSIGAVWFATVIATIPGEWQETAFAKLDRPRWQISYLEAGEQKTKLVSTHELLFAGEVDITTRRRKSLFSNTLVLQGFNLYEALKIDDPKKLAWKEHVFDLRARHLEQAVFDGADLTKTDLTGASLDGASLQKAQLQGASLDEAQLQGASLVEATLQGASLEGAQLQGASLAHAQLQGASLSETGLQGASLDYADLQAAILNFARLQGASLDMVDLQGASLFAADLRAASFAYAQMQGALLVGVMRANNVTSTIFWRTQWNQIGAKLRFLSDPIWKPLLAESF